MELSNISALDKVRLCTEVLLDKQAAEVVVLDVRSISSFADYFIICSGQTNRQVLALAHYVEESLSMAGLKPLGSEGKEEGRWVLLDFNEVIIHIFQNPVREFFDLEGLWSEAKRHNLDITQKLPSEEMQVTNQVNC